METETNFCDMESLFEDYKSLKDEIAVIEKERAALSEQRAALGDKIHKKRAELADKKREIMLRLESANVRKVEPITRRDDPKPTPVQATLDGIGPRDDGRVPLKAGSIALRVLQYIKNNPGCTTKDITRDVTHREIPSEASNLFYRKFISREDGKHFFLSWYGISQSEYKAVRKKRLTDKEANRKITSLTQEKSALLSTREVAEFLGVSDGCALKHLKRCEENGTVEKMGHGAWASPGMVPEPGQRNTEEADD